MERVATVFANAKEKVAGAAAVTAYTLALGTGIGYLDRTPFWEGPLAGALSAVCLLAMLRK